MDSLYRPAPRLLHWLIAAIVIPLILAGLVLRFWGGMALIALLGAHIAAVVHHHRQGIPVLRRMWR